MNRDKWIFLALLIFLLASGAYFINALFYDIPAPTSQEGNKEPIPEKSEEKKIKRKINYTVIKTKNVFNPDRSDRPKDDIAAGLAVPDIPVEPPPQLSLKGIVQDIDGEFTAYVAMNNEEARPVHVGERIDNLKVVSITITDVTIRWFEQEIKLTLSKVKSVSKQGK